MFRTSLTSAARPGALLAVVAASVIVLTGCSGGDSTSTSSSSSTASGTSAVSAKVTAASAAITDYGISTDAVDGSAAKGKTIYYIPITQQAPQFAITAASLKEALNAVGAKLQVCDGGGNPSAIAACVGQATQAKAGGIILDSIAYELATTSLDAAQKAGIPVIITDQIPDSAHPASATYAQIDAPAPAQTVALMDWITADSNSKATIVVNQSADGAAPAAYVAAGKKELSAECPDCKLVTNDVTTANFSLVPSSTSSALLKNPDANYLFVQFDQYLQASQGGVQQSGRTDLKIVTGSASLSTLQALAKGGQLAAVVAQDVNVQAYQLADAMIRMISGTSGADLPKYVIPSRLFTADNIKSITLTAAAQATGEWFGATTFVDQFKKLWGAA
jgi:ribose transport system substrate-binding protein